MHRWLSLHPEQVSRPQVEPVPDVSMTKVRWPYSGALHSDIVHCDRMMWAAVMNIAWKTVRGPATKETVAETRNTINRLCTQDGEQISRIHSTSIIQKTSYLSGATNQMLSNRGRGG